MKRGRIFIYIALIIFFAVAAGAYFLLRRPSTTQPPASQVTPQMQYVGIVTAGQNISPGMAITEGMLSSLTLPSFKD
jgi:Flp pilus assembly protein CpaB